MRTISAPVNNIKVDQERDLYYLGEQINCTAEGYPPPEFTWIPEVSGVMDTINGSVLTITPEMTGENQWTCEALNVINGLEHAVSTNISFNVGKWNLLYEYIFYSNGNHLFSLFIV